MLRHAFLCVCTARTAMPAPRGCLRRCRRINLPPCEKMCPSTQDLLRVRGVRAVSLLPSRLALSLPARIASPSRCTALTSFYEQPWLHHVAAFIWSEMLPAALPRGRGTLRAFSGPSGDNTLLAGVTHGGRRCGENISFWWDVEAEAAFPQRLLETGHPFPRQRVKDQAWRCRFDRWNTCHRTSTHYGPSCKVACSSRKPWTSGTLVLGLSQAMLLRSWGALCKPVSPQSEPIHAFLQRARAHFQIVFVRAKGSCLIPWMILLCRLSLRSESAFILNRKHVIM